MADYDSGGSCGRGGERAGGLHPAGAARRGRRKGCAGSEGRPCEGRLDTLREAGGGMWREAGVGGRVGAEEFAKQRGGTQRGSGRGGRVVLYGGAGECWRVCIGARLCRSLGSGVLACGAADGDGGRRGLGRLQ